MKKDTQKRIEEYKAKLPGVKERIAAIALMLVVSIVMMTSASYAWITISRAPEVKGMNTTISGNGNLEIALVNPEGTTPGNATGEESGLLSSNITWGNLVNLSDSGYGVDQIALRPALLSGYNRHSTPLYGASYDASGRVTSTSTTYSYATWKQAEDGSWYFDAANPTYGVRAIASVTYENISGNAAANKLLQNAKNAYVEARGLYLDIIDNDYLISSPGVYPEVYSMDALSKILQVFVQEKADYYVARLNGTEAADIPPADYSKVVVYSYRLVLAFQEVLAKEGEGLVCLANLQAYKNGAPSTETFKTIDDLLVASTTTLKNYGISLESVASYKTDAANIKKSIAGLEAVIEQNGLDEFSTGKNITWSKRADSEPNTYIGTYINYLVDINTTTIAQNRNSEAIAIGNINSNTLNSLLTILQNCQERSSPADVVVYNGILSNVEKRLPEAPSYTLEGNNTVVSIPLTVQVKMIIINIDMKDTPVYAAVRTTAAEPFISNNDFATTESMGSVGGDKGEAVANDTYGMAVDMWVRTNVSNVVLTLEGNLVTEMQPEYGVDKKGNRVQLYVLTFEGESVEVYHMVEDGVGNWYDAENHSVLGTDDEIGSLNEKGEPINVQEGYTIETKMVEIVVGYDGVNRVWEDYLSLIEAGLMAENNTTQGSGSCYVFYADPSDQARILHLLEAFTVVFIDSEGTTLGTAKLDTEHYYSINGKTTVPLQMVTGKAYYLDENGDQQLGLTALNKNEATWVTAIIYLDGQRLSNADVLAVGEIEGSLNIQFGSSISLNNMDDEKLRFEFREITASATSGGFNTTNSEQPITYKYDGNAKEVTVTLTVDGEQPQKIRAFFVRSISQTQGTREETVEFTPNGNNTWSATFSLTKPGTYSLRNLIVDGSDYELYDGTKSAEDVDNFPTIIIEGMGITSVHCMLPQGVTMTADTSVAAEVSVSINASGDLMPKKVRALFRSAENVEFSANLSYNERQGNWSGTAIITESGTYTLEYLVIDGQYTLLDEEMQTNHIIYLGLTAQVWSSGALMEDGTYATTFEYKGPTTVDVTMKLYDRSGIEIGKQEDVWMYYHAEGSVLDQDGMYNQLYWNDQTGYYEGQLTLLNGGTFSFHRVVTNASDSNPSTIQKAAVSPVFTAYVTDPPEYQRYTKNEYQFVPNGGATMSVTLTNAQTATMWAEIKDLTTGESYMVKLGNEEGAKTALDTDANLYSFTFQIPTKENKQDGEWQLMTLYMQGVARPNENPNEDPVWTPVTGDEPTTENSYVIDLSGDAITTYVVETVNISITDSSGNKYTGEVFGKDASGNITGTFMQAYNATAITVTIKDWNNQPIEGVTGITWLSDYEDNSATYGGYTGPYEDPPTVTLSGSGTTYTLASQTFRMAGSYTSKFTIAINGVEKDVTGPSFQVWSKAPTVTISSVSSNASTDRYYLSSTPSSLNVIAGSYNKKIDDYNAIVYMYVSAQSGTLDQEQVKIKYPSVTLALTGVPTSHSGVTMAFPGGNNTTSTFKFAAGSMTASTTIGSGADGVFDEGILGFDAKVETWPVFYPAGKQTVSQIQVTYRDVVYTVNLSNAVTINNPQYPPYADFTIDDARYTGTVPGRVYSTNGETIVLPDIENWTNNNVATALSTKNYPDPTASSAGTYYYDRGWWRYYTYTRTMYTQSCTVSSQIDNITYKLQWKVGNTLYEPGTEIPISGAAQITAVITEVDRVYVKTESVTYTKTWYTYAQTGTSKSGTEISFTPNASTKYDASNNVYDGSEVVS